MSEHDTAAEIASKPSPWIWILTLTVATLPVVFGLYQVSVFFDESFPHIYWSRTLPALLGVGLVFAGIAVPVWVVIKRRRFCRWRRRGQWLAFGAVALVMAFAYLLPFVRLADAARESRAIIPYTPGVFLHYSADDEPPYSFGVAGGHGTGHGSGHGGREGITFTWNAWLEPKNLSRPSGPDPVVNLRCEAPNNGDPLEVEITTGRTVRFDTRGFDNPQVKQDGKPVTLPTELPAGTHHFTVHINR